VGKFLNLNSELNAPVVPKVVLYVHFSPNSTAPHRAQPWGRRVAALSSSTVWWFVVASVGLPIGGWEAAAARLGSPGSVWGLEDRDGVLYGL
jgi:hypothetical protein